MDEGIHLSGHHNSPCHGSYQRIRQHGQSRRYLSILSRYYYIVNGLMEIRTDTDGIPIGSENFRNGDVPDNDVGLFFNQASIYLSDTRQLEFSPG